MNGLRQWLRKPMTRTDLVLALAIITIAAGIMIVW